MVEAKTIQYMITTRRQANYSATNLSILWVIAFRLQVEGITIVTI